MITRLLSVARVAKHAKRSTPYVRALIDAGVIDAFQTETGWRGCPPEALKQIRDHEARKSALASIKT